MVYDRRRGRRKALAAARGASHSGLESEGRRRASSGRRDRRTLGGGAAPRTGSGRSGLRDLTPRTRATYAGVLRQLAVWLDGRRLDDESLAAYLTHLRDAGGAPSTAALTVSALRRESREAGRRDVTAKLTRRVLEDFRRKTGSDAPRRPGLTADECAAVLEACMHRRRSGRGLERAETAERRGLVDGALVALLFHDALRRKEQRDAEDDAVGADGHHDHDAGAGGARVGAGRTTSP